MTTIPAGTGQAMAPSLAEAVAAKVAAGARFAGLFGTALPAGPAVTGTTGRPAGRRPRASTRRTLGRPGRPSVISTSLMTVIWFYRPAG